MEMPDAKPIFRSIGITYFLSLEASRIFLSPFVFRILPQYVYIFDFFPPYLWHREVPGPGIEPEPQQWQCWILNLLDHQGTP